MSLAKSIRLESPPRSAATSMIESASILSLAREKLRRDIDGCSASAQPPSEADTEEASPHGSVPSQYQEYPTERDTAADEASLQGEGTTGPQEDEECDPADWLEEEPIDDDDAPVDMLYGDEPGATLEAAGLDGSASTMNHEAPPDDGQAESE